MINPFKNLKTDNKDKIKAKLENEIKTIAWSITTKFAIGRCKVKDINLLEKKYKEYFLKYPDVKRENNSIKRISQLRMMVK